MPENEVMGEMGDDMVARVGAISAGTGEPSEEVTGESEAWADGHGDRGKETGTPTGEYWND